jgi:serine/threonine protein kinase
MTCAYCSRTLVGTADASWALRVRPHDEDDALDPRPWCRVDGQKHIVLGQLGAGETSDVFLGERAQRPTERVVIKVGRGREALAPMATQWKRLEALSRSEDRRAPMMTTLLPQLVVLGWLKGRARDGLPALVTRWRSGYQYTLVDAQRAYPAGIDARTAVWVWRRVLDLLSWIHDHGVVHSSVRPEHVLLHPRDHGAVLVGWSHAATLERRSDATNDVIQSAATVRLALAGPLPRPLQAVLDDAARGREPDAARLCERVCVAAREAFGPPRYHPFTMPD